MDDICPLLCKLHLFGSYHRPTVLLLILLRLSELGSVVSLHWVDRMDLGDLVVYVHQSRQAHGPAPPPPFGHILPASLDRIWILPRVYQDEGLVDLERGKSLAKQTLGVRKLTCNPDILGQPSRWRHRQRRAYDPERHARRHHDQPHLEHAGPHPLQGRYPCLQVAKQASIA